jgi:hypothetical protein
MGGEQGDLLLGSTRHKTGSLGSMDNCSNCETSVGMYKLKGAIEKFCSDLLVTHQRKCVCALAGMATWRFSMSPKGDEITTHGYRVQTFTECKLL